MVMRRILAAGTVGLMVVLAGCAGSRVASERGGSEGAATGGMIAQLTFPAESDASIGTLVNYNPYAPKQQTKTWLYEPLMIQSSLDCSLTPWLATGYRWDGATKLTFDIREGVKWSDGSDFTAADVAFTFNLMKTYPGIDTAGVWTDTLGAPATSVTAEGNQVVFAFSGDAVPKFNGIIGKEILAEKQYASVGDPTKFVNLEPVSTGPFSVGSYNGRRLELVRRPDYWQADKIKVEKLVLEGNYDANQAALKLRSGGLDFYTGEIPNPEKTFVSADPKLNHVWYAPNGLTVLAPNLTRKPFNDVKFREALAYAMDKESATQKATYGLMDVASQSGLVLPAKANLLPAQYPAESTVIPLDLNKANDLLDAAGYRKDSDGKRTYPDGSPLSITFSVQAGYIDYEAMADEFVSNFRELGLDHQGQQGPAGLGGPAEEERRLPVDDQLHGRRLRLRERHGGHAEHVDFPDQDHGPRQCRPLLRPAGRRGDQGTGRDDRRGSHQGTRRGDGRGDDDRVPCTADPVRPGPQHLPHRQGGRAGRARRTPTAIRRTTPGCG